MGISVPRDWHEPHRGLYGDDARRPARSWADLRWRPAALYGSMGERAVGEHSIRGSLAILVLDVSDAFFRKDLKSSGESKFMCLSNLETHRRRLNLVSGPLA